MKRLLPLLLSLGCASADGHPPVPSPEAQHETSTVVELADVEDETSVPLCEGAHEPRPNECQTLVYGNTGYCNRWSPCAR